MNKQQLQYTQPFKCLGSVRFPNVYKRSFLCSTRLHLFNQIYSKTYSKKVILKYYYKLNYLLSVLLYFKMSFIPLIAKLNFQRVT